MLKKVMVLALLLGAGYSACAADYAYPEKYKVSYTLDTFLNAGDRIYYNCDSVESKTKSLLKQLGAEHVRVSCTGGFDSITGFAGPAYVTVKFIAPTMIKNNAAPRMASVREINLRGDDDCHFMTTTLEALAEDIELDVVAGPRFCSSGHFSSNFVVSVLAFED